MNKTLSIIVTLGVVLGGVLLWQTNSAPSTNPLGEKVIVYKTLTCGCCEVYTKYLERKGVSVEVMNVDDLTPIKKEHGVPTDVASCHTSLVGGYVVEGHVPLEVIERLLVERPDIRGIALPGMPSGTPGMPGPKTGEWIFYSLENDGGVGEYMKM